MFALNRNTTAERIYKVVKELPEKEQKKSSRN